MILVGMTGTIGSGKSTLAEQLARQTEHHGHWESSELIMEVANGLRTKPLAVAPTDLTGISDWLGPLPYLVESITHKQMDPELAQIDELKIAQAPELYDKLITYAGLLYANPSLQSGPITADNKDQLRSLLQWLGGFLAKTVSGDIWYHEIVARIKLTPKIELATIGGVRFPADAAVIRAAGGFVIRIERPYNMAQDSDDITERESSLITADAVITNNGSLEELETCAQQLFIDLAAGTLQQTYIART